MQRISFGTAALYLRVARGNIQWMKKKHGNTSFSYAAFMTTSKQLQEDNDPLKVKPELLKKEDIPFLFESFEAKNPLEVIDNLVNVVRNNGDDFRKALIYSSRFKRLLETTEENLKYAAPMRTIDVLKNLQELGVQNDSPIFKCGELELFQILGKRLVILQSSPQSGESTVLWNIRKVTVSTLLRILAFHAPHQKTDLQKKIVKGSLQHIERRWTEIKFAKDFQFIYTHCEHFKSGFLGRMDDRATEMIEFMTSFELCEIFCALGSVKRRPTPLLRALAYHIAKGRDELTIKQITNMLYAINRLSFPEQALLQKIAKSLSPQIDNTTKPSVIRSIFLCMGQMRWREPVLLEALSVWVEKNIENCNVPELASLVITLACLSYVPRNADSLFEKVIPLLTVSSFTKESVWVDVVWSLVVLGRATNDHIVSVLDPSFVSKNTSVSQHLFLGVKLKLLHINAVAKLTMPSCNGPQLDLEDFKDVIITQSRDARALNRHILKTLHNFFPPPKYINENIQTPFGIYVTCELALQKGKPVPIEDNSDSTEKWSTKHHPNGVTKVVVFAWDFHAYTIGTQKLTGINQLAVQLMENIGYKVVQVPYFEYNMEAKTVKHIRYLENKIKEAISVS